MKIAVTYEKGQVFQHFGHAPAFKVYDIEEGNWTKAEVVEPNGSGHAAMSGFLKDYGVDIVICGGIGAPALEALAGLGMTVYPGQSGSCDDLVQALLEGKLQVDPNYKSHACNHGKGHHH